MIVMFNETVNNNYADTLILLVYLNLQCMLGL